MRLVAETDRVNKHNPELINGPLKKLKVKYSLQVHICGQSNEKFIRDVYEKLNKCRGYEQADQIRDFYLATELFDQSTTINCLFRINDSRSGEDLEQIETVRYLVSSLSPLVNICIHKPIGGTSHNKNGIVPLFSENRIAFGSLATPFEFYSRNNWLINQQMPGKVKIILDFGSKVLRFLYFNANGSGLEKFEIRFESIDQIICIDLNQSQDYFCVYLPLNRMPFYFRHAESIGDVKLTPESLKSIDEETLDWTRTCKSLSTHSDLTLKLTFSTDKPSEKIHVIKSFSNLNEKCCLFTRIESKELKYTLDEFRTNRNVNFEFTYLMEAFTSQFDYLLNGKLDAEFTQLLLNHAQGCAKKLEIILQKLMLRLSNRRFLSLKNSLNSVVSEIQNDAKIHKNEIDLFSANLKGKSKKYSKMLHFMKISIICSDIMLNLFEP